MAEIQTDLELVDKPDSHTPGEVANYLLAKNPFDYSLLTSYLATEHGNENYSGSSLEQKVMSFIVKHHDLISDEMFINILGSDKSLKLMDALPEYKKNSIVKSYVRGKSLAMYSADSFSHIDPDIRIEKISTITNERGFILLYFDKILRDLITLYSKFDDTEKLQERLIKFILKSDIATEPEVFIGGGIIKDSSDDFCKYIFSKLFKCLLDSPDMRKNLSTLVKNLKSGKFDSDPIIIDLLNNPVIYKYLDVIYYSNTSLNPGIITPIQKQWSHILGVGNSILKNGVMREREGMRSEDAYEAHLIRINRLIRSLSESDLDSELKSELYKMRNLIIKAKSNSKVEHITATPFSGNSTTLDIAELFNNINELSEAVAEDDEMVVEALDSEDRDDLDTASASDDSRPQLSLLEYRASYDRYLIDLRSQKNLIVPISITSSHASTGHYISIGYQDGKVIVSNIGYWNHHGKLSGEEAERFKTYSGVTIFDIKEGVDPYAVFASLYANRKAKLTPVDLFKGLDMVCENPISIPAKKQKIGNCTHANVKTYFKALMPSDDMYKRYTKLERDMALRDVSSFINFHNTSSAFDMICRKDAFDLLCGYFNGHNFIHYRGGDSKLEEIKARYKVALDNLSDDMKASFYEYAENNLDSGAKIILVELDPEFMSDKNTAAKLEAFESLDSKDVEMLFFHLMKSGVEPHDALQHIQSRSEFSGKPIPMPTKMFKFLLKNDIYYIPHIQHLNGAIAAFKTIGIRGAYYLNDDEIFDFLIKVSDVLPAVLKLSVIDSFPSEGYSLLKQISDNVSLFDFSEEQVAAINTKVELLTEQVFSKASNDLSSRASDLVAPSDAGSIDAASLGPTSKIIFFSSGTGDVDSDVSAASAAASASPSKSSKPKKKS